MWIISMLNLENIIILIESWQAIAALGICNNYLQVFPWETDPSSQHTRLLYM